MRTLRYHTESGPQFGLLVGGEVTPLAGDPIAIGFVETPNTDRVRLEDLALDVPVAPPSKIICIGRNYRSHSREMGWSGDAEPVVFLKPPSALVPHGAPVHLPAAAGLVEPEPELAIVIGRSGRHIPRAKAAAHIYGYTIANDVSARDLMTSDGQWARAKGFDTFCPLGPWVETDFDPNGARIRLTVDGLLVTDASTDAMQLDYLDLVAWCSTVFTLMPGDLILTGSPAGRLPLVAGMSVRVAIEGIGELENSIVEAAAEYEYGRFDLA